jgi:hypothetical protein
VSHQFEIGLRKEVRHIALRPGEVVVDTKYVGTLGDEAITKVGAKKAGTAGDKDFVHRVTINGIAAVQDGNRILCILNCP